MSCQQHLTEKRKKEGNTPSCFEGHVLLFQTTVSSLQECQVHMQPLKVFSYFTALHPGEG